MELSNKLNPTEFKLNTDLGIYTHLDDLKYNDLTSKLPKIYLLGRCIFSCSTVTKYEESFPYIIGKLLPQYNILSYSFPYNTLINIFNTIKKVVEPNSIIIMYPTRLRHPTTEDIFTNEEADIIFSSIIDIAKVKNCKLYAPIMNESGLMDLKFKYTTGLEPELYETNGRFKKEHFDIVADGFVKMLNQEPVSCNYKVDIDKFEQLIIESQKKDLSVLKTNTQYVKYLNEVAKLKVEDGKTKGILGGSFNPFTFGHQKLIEYAASKVDVLYIMTDKLKLELPQDVRYKTLQAGIKHLKNVIILPTSDIMHSMITFGDYVVKKYQHLAGTVFYSECLMIMDVIKILGVTHRVHGAEPEDIITNKYIEDFKKINEAEGNIVEFVVIPRIEMGKAPISASKCRKFLQNKEYDKVKDYIPAAVIEELKKYYDSL